MTKKIKFEQLLIESKRFYQWKNKWILATRHGLEQLQKRLQEPIETIKPLFKKAINKTLELGLSNNRWKNESSSRN